MLALRNTLKAGAGQIVATLNPQCSFRNCVFILAHMRCGSTALSNILCSRPDISGYGEAHIRYDSQAALGRLVVNQALRNGWSARAPHLFDKILHSRHDSSVPPEFFQARAIFVARSPGPAIRSIRALYDGLGRGEYGTDLEAATYYVERVGALIDLWHCFPADRRVGLTHSALMAAPEGELARISARLGIAPALENRYASPAASRKGGAGDPGASGQFTKIEIRAPHASQARSVALDVPSEVQRAADDAYARFVATIGSDQDALD